METQKTLKNQNNTEKKDQSWRYHTLSFQTILQSYSHQNSMTLAQKQTHRTMQQNREPRNEPILIWAINLWQRRQVYTMRKRQPLQ